LAVLLAVPQMTDAGHPLAGRDDIIYLGFGVIIVTLVGQGTTLPVLVGRLRLTEHPSVAEVERQARLVLTHAVLKRLQNAEDAVGGELTDGLRAQYLARRQRLESSDGLLVEDPFDDAAGADRALEHDLDLEDARL
jgi:CPA1 family monovalent cation:H+ antiporter